MTAFIVGAALFGLACALWARRTPPPGTTLVLPTWDGLPRDDLKALPDLDPWDPRLGG